MIDNDIPALAGEEKVLVILKNGPTDLRSQENFLKNRGWTIYSSHRVSEVLAIIIKKRCKFVMLSADHAHKKVKVLPQLLQQAFGTQIIGFCEKNLSASVRDLQEMSLQYNIFPPVSGPAIERMILRIRKEAIAKNAENKMHLGSAKSEDNMITISGESAAKAKSDLMALLQDTKPAPVEMIIQKGLSGASGHYNPNFDSPSGNTKILKSSVAPNLGIREHASIYESSVQKALDHALVDWGDKEVSVIAPKQVVCMTIDNPNFKGYLVAAMDQDRRLNSEFTQLVKIQLCRYLKTNGVEVPEDLQLFDMTLMEVPFQDWSLQCADFLIKSDVKEGEIAIAFFPNQDCKVDLEGSIAENMLKMELNDIRDDAVLQLDLFLHLPENDKYILYNPSGRVFRAENIKRLREKGVTHVHLRKESLAGIKRYKAENFLNDLIKEFKKRGPASAGNSPNF